MNLTVPEKGNYSVREDRNVYVAMRDGVHLCVDVFRPNVEGKKFPALLAMSPYGKWKQSLKLSPQTHESPIFDAAIEAGDPYFLAKNGYAHAIADVRGSGNAEGDYHGWMSKFEARDGYDLVEWIASQEWCDGNVGMVGISYFGTIQLMVAAEQPPHLKAIMPWNGVADFYREATHHGGMFQNFFMYLYSSAIPASTFVSDIKASKKEIFQQELLKDESLQMYPDLFKYAENPALNGNMFDIMAEKYDGPFYWERSPNTMYDKIKIPVYCESNWWAYAHMHLYGAFWNFLGIDASKKLQIGPTVIEERPLGRDYNEEVLRWYDHWLKGIENGIMEEPPIRLFVRGANRWRFESEWPLKRTMWTSFYLASGGRLTTELEEPVTGPDCFVQQPVIENPSINSVKYVAPLLEDEFELTGPGAFYMHAAIDQTDTNWIVSLRDWGDDGSEVEITKGFLKASHRALDIQRSKPWEPWHPHDRSEPVEPHQIYEYVISLAPMSCVFKRGHRLKLVICSMDHAKSRDTRIAPLSMGRNHYPWHLGIRKTILHKIFFGPDYPSRLYLPVVPRRE